MRNTRVFFNFCQVTQSEFACDMRVELSCSARKLYFECYMRFILRVLHDCKKHVSSILCAAHGSVFLCTAHKLTAILCQRRIKAYNEMAH